MMLSSLVGRQVKPTNQAKPSKALSDCLTSPVLCMPTSR